MNRAGLLFAAIGFLVMGWPLAAAGQGTGVHHDIVLAYEPESRNIDVTVSVKTPEGGAVSLRVARWLNVERVVAGDTALSFRREGETVTLRLPAAEQATATIALGGQVPALQGRGGGHGAVAHAQGTYLPGFSAWAADTGEDWITYSVQLVVKGGQVGVATGRLVSESKTGEEYRARFIADYPAELPSVFIGPYEINERQYGKIRIRTYFHKDIAAHSAHYLDASARYIEKYATLIGAYPFDDFHVVASPLPVGLGFPNLTYIGRMIVPLPFMRGRSLAHEVLHNWWGNGVAIDYGRGNWAEGLTTFMADYGLAEARGPEAAREMRLGWLRDFAALPTARDMPVSAFTAKTHQAAQVIGYNKVAQIFHMLRQELGQEVFADGLRRFWQHRKFTVAGWPDIRSAFEAASQRDLEPYFAQWLDRPGAPRIELAAAEQRRDMSVSVTLRQEDPLFDVTVPLEIETADGVVQRRRVRLAENEKTYRIPLRKAARQIRVDPDFDVFRRLLPGESPPILRDVTLAQSITAVLLDSDAAYREASRALLQRLLDKASVVFRDAGGAPQAGTAVVVGSTQQLAEYLQRTGNRTIPPEVQAGTAAAWVARDTGGDPILFIRADTPDLLRSMARSLPHYGSRSFVAFDGRRAAGKGVWRMPESPLTITLPHEQAQ